MTYALNLHPKGYEITYNELLLFPVHSVYADRHWQLGNEKKELWLGHKVIAIVESIPFIGALASLIERVAVWVMDTFFTVKPPQPDTNRPNPTPVPGQNPPTNSSTSPPPVSSTTQAIPPAKPSAASTILRNNEPKKTPAEKMLKNMNKAAIEHASNVDSSDLEIKDTPQPVLKLTFHEHETQGPRHNMEDAHFYKSFEQGTLLGIFDGHGDNGLVATMARDMFRDQFVDELAKNGDDIREAFTTLIDAAHKKVVENKMAGGTTAVVCFIDAKTNIVYTATLADSEAKIYRKKGDQIETIPLSCVRDWCHKREIARAKNVNPQADYDDAWAGVKAKYRRFPSKYGINISRSIGDLDLGPGLIRKPKITTCRMKPGDLLVAGCDGLWDYAPADKLINDVVAPAFVTSDYNIAEKACKLSLDHQGGRSGDNVTVMAIRAQ